MNINTPSNSNSFSPLEYSESRAFLTDLQPWLETETGMIFKQRYIKEFGEEKWQKDFKGKNAIPNEPEDLYTLSQNQPQKYFEALKKVAEFWEGNFQESMKIAFELADKNPQESMKIYYAALAKVYAENYKKSSKIAEEKLAEMIQKELMRKAPYYQAAMSMLMNAVQGISLRSISNTIKTAVERIIWPNNKKGGLTKIDFRNKKVISQVEGKDPIVEEKEKENPEFEAKYNKMTELLRDKIAARRYMDILLMPINSHSTIKERTLLQIQRNPGFQSLTEIFKDLTGEYDRHPERILNLGYVDFFRFLGNLTAIASMAEVLDSYEKKITQYSLVMLCEKVIRELTEVYFLKHSGKNLTHDEIRERMSMVIGSGNTVDILSGRKKGMSIEDLIEKEDYEVVHDSEIMTLLPWLKTGEESPLDALMSIGSGAVYDLKIQGNASTETIKSLIDEMFERREKEPKSVYIVSLSKKLSSDKKEAFMKYLKEQAQKQDKK